MKRLVSTCHTRALTPGENVQIRESGETCQHTAVSEAGAAKGREIFISAQVNISGFFKLTPPPCEEGE